MLDGTPNQHQTVTADRRTRRVRTRRRERAGAHTDNWAALAAERRAHLAAHSSSRLLFLFPPSTKSTSRSRKIPSSWECTRHGRCGKHEHPRLALVRVAATGRHSLIRVTHAATDACHWGRISIPTRSWRTSSRSFSKAFAEP